MKNAGKACNNRLYRHIRTFEKIVKNYFVILLKLIYRYSDEYIAFFEMVIQDIFFSEFDCVVQEFEKMRGNINICQIPSMIKNNFVVNTNVGLEAMFIAAERRKNMKAGSFE